MSRNYVHILKRRLLRGEGTIAVIALAAAAIMLFIMTCCGLWARSIGSKLLAERRISDLQNGAALLSASLEPLLCDNDLSSARRLVVVTGQALHLSECRVTIGNQQIVADLHPSQVNVVTLPLSWSVGTTADPDQEEAGPKALRLTVPLRVPGRGAAILKVEAAPVAAATDRTIWDLQTGIGAIGATGLCSLLLVYRVARRRSAVVEAMRESLLAYNAGELAQEALLLDASLGEEALGWNRLLEERKVAKQAAVTKQVTERLTDRRRGGGELSTACDSLSQGLLLIDDHLRVQFVNGAAAVLLKRRRADVANLPITDLISDEKVLSGIRSVAQQGLRRPVTVEASKQDDEGHGVLKYSVRPVRNDDNAAAMIVIEDVTQQRVADRARNAFVSQVTHELRTPLTNIRLYVENAIEEFGHDPASVEQSLNVINSESRRLERIVGEMLSISEIEAGCMKLKTDDVRLETLFAELQRDYQPQADDKRIKLAFNLPPKFPVINGDRDKITLALHNLVGNALKYTLPGGTVAINADLKDGHFVIDVTDSGIGIKPDEQERVFERFYRANDPRIEKITGTGLGLTLAREVLRMHGGDVTIESQLDRGSTFTATLPVRRDAA